MMDKMEKIQYEDDKVKSLSNREPNHYIRRGVFFHHRDLDQVLKKAEDRKSFLLRCRYLQEPFEPQHQSNKTMTKNTELKMQKIQKPVDSILKKFIMLDTDCVGQMGELQSTSSKVIFGLTESVNCGKASYPAIQAAIMFSSSFKHIFGMSNGQQLL